MHADLSPASCPCPARNPTPVAAISPSHQGQIRDSPSKGSTTAFLDAYLGGDPQAKRWLANGGFKDLLGMNGTYETKPWR